MYGIFFYGDKTRTQCVYVCVCVYTSIFWKLRVKFIRMYFILACVSVCVEWINSKSVNVLGMQTAKCTQASIANWATNSFFFFIFHHALLSLGFGNEVNKTRITTTKKKRKKCNSGWSHECETNANAHIWELWFVLLCLVVVANAKQNCFQKSLSLVKN